MIAVDHDISIERDPQSVFDYVAQLDRYDEWTKEGGITAARKTSDGPVALGSTFVLERTARGRTTPIDCTITTFEPGRKLAFRSVDGDGFVGDFESTLTPVDGGTNLHWKARMQPPNLLYRLLQPIVQRAVAKSAELDLPRLKAKVEGAATTET